VQALETFRALRRLRDKSFVVELFNWSEVEQPADIYHFVGLPPYLSDIVHLVRSADRRFVITLLLGSNQGKSHLFAAAARRRVRSVLFGQSLRTNMIRSAVAVIVITEADAESAKLVYGIEEQRLHIIPNGVEDRFFKSSPLAWQEQFGDAPFILSVGAIQKRKNQLLLVEAANAIQLPVVLLGSVLPNEKSYADTVAKAMKVNETFGGRWIQSLRNEDELLVSAYAACRLFVLLSLSETQPLSVMQAMAARKPILLLNAAYTQDPLFCTLPTVDSDNIQTIAGSLKRVWNHGTQSSLPSNYTWDSVATKLSSIYQLQPTTFRGQFK